MILYRPSGDDKPQAIYFDNEGHVIRYAVAVSPDGNRITLESDAADGGARYRFTYTKAGPNALKLKFEIAPAGKPDQFATYIEAGARRK